MATIAFVQYGGLDEVIARDGTQSAARRLDELVRLVQDAVDRYDVCFLDSDIASDGGKIRLGAGVPRVVGDDEERMLLALRHIVEADPPLPVRVGVHRGPGVHRSGRTGIPAVVRGNGRHREPRGAAGGKGAGGSDLRHAGRPATGEDQL